ncbi:LPP leucine zipper domain-containing protein [Superficieibacter sp. BNK-5]
MSQLQQDVEALRSEVQSAKDEAARAQWRISSRVYTNPPRL